MGFPLKADNLNSERPPKEHLGMRSRRREIIEVIATLTVGFAMLAIIFEVLLLMHPPGQA